jgi:ABC-type antimicrobial peptide transport system permease subunit
MVVRRGLGYALGGSAIGIVLTLLEGRWLAGFLYGVGVADPVTMAGVSALLIATAAVACWLPGHQAGRIHPIEAIGGDG